MTTHDRSARLQLADGAVFPGHAFGFPATVAGEVVFNTGMVGYPEALTDPSYAGQILVCTYPLIGNYGVPGQCTGLAAAFESDRIQVAGLIVADVSLHYHHWSATKSLAAWLYEHRVPALTGVDTRALTKHLRQEGSMLGTLCTPGDEPREGAPPATHLVPLVSVRQPVVYPGGKKRVVVVDCGCKHSIIRSLLARGVTVIRVPWDYDFVDTTWDGVVLSNGPGNPKQCTATITHVQRAMAKGAPLFGICLGHQLMALAAGADTYKLKFGHRSQNQPCREVGTPRCYITSQNHGYAVDERTLPPGWEPWFVNANDGTNEGIRHRSLPFMSVQFHPEAAPGPVDTQGLFDRFGAML
jgi:carbamoyl-phosphate synthase small subunit